MTPILVLDFETTGLPLFDQPSDDPRQPHIVQAAAILVDADTRKAISSIDLIVKPDGWTIPDDVAAIHGITTERAAAVGVDEDIVVIALCRLWQVSTLRVGHNESFDARIMRIGLKRFVGEAAADAWKAGAAECTANLATPIMNMEATDAMKATGRGNKPKRPKLTEAYKFFTGEDMPNAHSAMGDVLGCLSVYWKIKDLAV